MKKPVSDKRQAFSGIWAEIWWKSWDEIEVTLTKQPLLNNKTVSKDQFRYHRVKGVTLAGIGRNRWAEPEPPRESPFKSDSSWYNGLYQGWRRRKELVTV